MRKTACEAILVEKPDQGKRSDLPAAVAAEIEALRAEIEHKDAENSALKAGRYQPIYEW